MPCLGELGRSDEGAGGHGAHAGPEAEIEKSPHQGLGIMGRDFPSSQPSWEMLRTAWVSPPTAYYGLLPWQTSQGPKKIDDKYNNTRCNHEGQLSALGWLLLSRLRGLQKPPPKKKTSVYFEGKLLSNVVIFPLRL